MARIASLNILNTNEGKDFLAEEYGKVIENVQKINDIGTNEKPRLERHTSKRYC